MFYVKSMFKYVPSLPNFWIQNHCRLHHGGGWCCTIALTQTQSVGSRRSRRRSKGGLHTYVVALLLSSGCLALSQTGPRSWPCSKNSSAWPLSRVIHLERRCATIACLRRQRFCFQTWMKCVVRHFDPMETVFYFEIKSILPGDLHEHWSFFSKFN